MKTEKNILIAFILNLAFSVFEFIGGIFTDMVTKEAPKEISFCSHCGACTEACPSRDNCLSALTQQKGELDENTISLMRKHHTAWGCDICQEVCPHNRELAVTHITEFCENLIINLEIDKSLSNKEFKKLYGNRAFSWRGKKVLERNLKIVKSDI